MFTKTQKYYDAIYGWKDYETESRRLTEIIASYKTSPGNTFLDVACGTGGHIPHLRQHFTVEGLDLDRDMLSLATAKHPDVPFHHGDMSEFDLGRQFDVVACLFSSVGYLKTPERLAKAVRNMARHVRPGGVLIVEPYFSPQQWQPRIRAPGASVVDKPEVSVVRMIDWVREGDLVTSTFHYLVGTAERVEYFSEQHVMGLFSDDDYRSAFTSAAMEVLHDAQGLMGRGLYIGAWPARGHPRAQ